jgi:hypothetical protein
VLTELVVHSLQGNVRVKVVQVVYNGENSDLPNRVINYCWRTKSMINLTFFAFLHSIYECLADTYACVYCGVSM